MATKPDWLYYDWGDTARESMEIFAIQRNYPAADVAPVVNIE